MTDVSFGCTLPTSGAAADPIALRDLAQTAEALGFDAVWVSDHVVIPAEIKSPYPYSPDGVFHLSPTSPYFEPLIALTYLAGCTSRIRLGTHVLILPYRNPVVMAKEIATLDVLSGGRFDFGIGVGWMKEEFEALGYDYFERRGAVTDEQVRVMQKLWSEDTPSHDGTFFRFGPTGGRPHPIQRPGPPIWVGGHTPVALRRTARLGDGWLPIGARPPADLPPDEIARGLDEIRTEARRLGRDADAIQVCFSTGISIQTDRPNRLPFRGTPAQIAGDFKRYRAVGVNRFVVGFGAGSATDIGGRMRRFAEEIAPAVRST
jgi:probable F420-dependent oxidoreductase